MSEGGIEATNNPAAPQLDDSGKVMTATKEVNNLVDGLDPSLAFELQSDEDLHENLVATYESLALVSALFLTMIYAFADGPPEAIEDSLWGEYTNEVVNVSGIVNGLAVVANLGCTFDCVLLLLRLSEIPASHTRLFVRTYGSGFMFSPYTLNGLGFWPFLIGIVLNYSLTYTIWCFIPVMFFAVCYIAWFTYNWNLHQEPSRAAVLKVIQEERDNPNIDSELKVFLDERGFGDMNESFDNSKLTLAMLQKVASRKDSVLLNDMLKDVGIDTAGDRLALILALEDVIDVKL